jgi:hypothetical protein
MEGDAWVKRTEGELRLEHIVRPEGPAKKDLESAIRKVDWGRADFRPRGLCRRRDSLLCHGSPAMHEA